MRISRIVVVVLLAALGAGCSGRAVEPEAHPLPRLPELGGVVLPGGFVGYDRPTAPYASRHPVHVDSAFFELEPSDDLGGNHHCRAQITVSRYDPALATPAAHTAELGTKLCDAEWFGTGLDGSWRPDPADPQLWTVDVAYTEVGWLSVTDLPAVGVVLFVPERGLTVGLWALDEVYPREEAVALAREVVDSIG